MSEGTPAPKEHVLRDEIATRLANDGHTVTIEARAVAPGLFQRQAWRGMRADLHVQLASGHPLHRVGLGVFVVECKRDDANHKIKSSIGQAHDYMRAVRWRTGTHRNVGVYLPRPECALICTPSMWTGRHDDADPWMLANERIAWMHHAGWLVRRPGRSLAFRLRDDEPQRVIWERTR